MDFFINIVWLCRVEKKIKLIIYWLLKLREGVKIKECYYEISIFIKVYVIGFNENMFYIFLKYNEIV